MIADTHTLPLFKAAHPAPDVSKLIALLDNERGWLTRKEIRDRTGWDERTIRMLAEAAHDKKGPIVIRWQKGFCHRNHADVEDIKRAADQFKSQGKLMIKDGIAYARLAHQKLATAQ